MSACVIYNYLTTAATDVTQKYILNMEGSDQWCQAQWEEFEHSQWEFIQILGDRYYELYENDSDEEDKEEVLRIMLWKEEP